MSRALARSLLAGAAVVALAAPVAAQDIRIMTGPQGGVWVPLGGQFKDMIEKNVAGARVSTLPGAGVANVRAIETGKAEIGFGNTITTADAVAGTGDAPLNEKHSKVCNVATLYPQFFQVVVPVNAGIDRIADVKGKGFATQVRGNTGEAVARHLLQAVGLSYKDVKASFTNSYTDSVEQVKDGRMHMFTLGTAIPASSVMDLASARDVKLLDLTSMLPEMKKLNKAYQLVTIPKGTYPKQDRDIGTIGYYTHVIAACSLAPDLIHKFAGAMLAGRKGMSAVNKDMESLTAQIMAQDIGVPFHEGARRWYKEQGITVQ